MIRNVERIDPFSLPSVALGQRDQLPDVSGIYFAILGAEILYIGKSINLQQRWQGHHRTNQLKSYGEVIIAWFSLEGLEDILDELEEACIEHFKPVLNSAVVPREFIAWKKKSTYSISEEAKQLLIILSQKLGVSETSIIEIAVRKFAEMERVRSGTSEQVPHSNKTSSALIV